MSTKRPLIVQDGRLAELPQGDSLLIPSYQEGFINHGTTGGAVTFDANSAPIHKITLNTDLTPTFVLNYDGQGIVLGIESTATVFTIIWGNIKWAGASIPDITENGFVEIVIRRYSENLIVGSWDYFE